MTINYYTSKCLTQQVLILMTLMLASKVSAQTHYQNGYTADLDSLWSRNIYIKNLTSDGKWVTFTEVFDHKEATVWLQHSEGNVTFKYPKAQGMTFSKNNRWFACIVSTKGLYLADLRKRTQQLFENCVSFSFSNTGEYVAAVRKTQEGEPSLWLKNLNSGKETIVKNVDKYLWHPVTNTLLLTIKEENQHRAMVVEAKSQEQKVIYESSKNSFTHCSWSGSGNAVMLLEQGSVENHLHYYSATGILKTIGSEELNRKFPMATLSNSKPHMSNDGKKILFYRQDHLKRTLPANEGVEIWESDSPWIGSKMNEYEINIRQMQATVWYPETGELMAVETEETPSSALDINHPFALVFNELQYEPLYKEFVNTDLYALDMATGKKEKVVENQYIGPGFVSISPMGKHIAYFKDNHWWVYNAVTRQTTNPTKNLDVTLRNESRNLAGDVAPYGNPGWTSDDKHIVLYDQFDIWLCTVDGSYKNRLTNGREEQITYRINKEYARNNDKPFTVNRSFSSSAINTAKGFLMDVEESRQHKTGYAFWNQEDKVKIIISEDRKIDGIVASENFGSFVFKKQKFNEPPSIHAINRKNKKQRLLFQSNTELLKYDLGRNEQISYEVDGKQLFGTLLYPAHFDARKKYPMIVYIYEKAAKQVNDFNPPSSYEYIGFNCLKFSTDDYFILYPDISYTIGNPGMSALKCVTSALDEAIENVAIDPNRIGLVGHSFGGYEAAFIASHSDRFVAIVAGAAVTNFTSHYHSVGWNWKQPEIWRYENQQWRMGDSYYENKEGYLRNSPLHHIENINTPLLLWTGREDYQVHWSQSVELFIALKRLRKKSKLILVEKETHFVLDKSKQYQLSKIIKEWFDHYCK